MATEIFSIQLELEFIGFSDQVDSELSSSFEDDDIEQSQQTYICCSGCSDEAVYFYPNGDGVCGVTGYCLNEISKLI